LLQDTAEQSDQAAFNELALVARRVKESLCKCREQLDQYSANESNSAVSALRFLLSELMEVAHASNTALQNQSKLLSFS